MFDPDQLDVQPSAQVEAFQKSAQPLQNSLSEDTVKLITGILRKCHDYYKVYCPAEWKVTFCPKMDVVYDYGCIISSADREWTWLFIGRWLNSLWRITFFTLALY